MKPANQNQQASVFDKKDIQALLLDIEDNRKLTGTKMQPGMEDATDSNIFTSAPKPNEVSDLVTLDLVTLDLVTLDLVTLEVSVEIPSFPLVLPIMA